MLESRAGRRKILNAALSVLVSALLVLEPVAAMAQGGRLHLRQGTPLYVRPVHELRSDTSHTGDNVEFEVEEPVPVRGVTLIVRGARARGVVTRAKHASGLGQDGILDISIESVSAVDGTPIRLRATAESRGHSQGSNTALSVGLIVFVSVFGVFLQGREAVIPADREFTVYVDEDRDFQVAAPEAGGIGGQPHAVPLPTVRAWPRPPAAYPPGTPPGAVVDQTVCQRVERGEPETASHHFRAGVPRIMTWFRVAPPLQDTVYEVHWYREDHLEAASSPRVRAGGDRAWAVLERPEGGTFRSGDWKVLILKDGQLQSLRPFTVTR